MMAAELYQKTLAGYEASLGKGESMSLSRYCKIHHVNNRGLRYWMKKHSIDPPKNKSRKVTTQSDINNISQPLTSSGHMIPLLIQSPGVENIIMNDSYIIDTTSLISYFHKIFEVPKAISDASIDIIRRGFNGELKIIIPSIVFIELFCKWYTNQEIIEKIRSEVIYYIMEQDKIHICPIDIEVLENIAMIIEKNSSIKFDNHDKQVLATAMMYNCTLITSDKKIIRFVKKYSVIPNILS
jgi:hypothetical protein